MKRLNERVQKTCSDISLWERAIYNVLRSQYAMMPAAVFCAWRLKHTTSGAAVKLFTTPTCLCIARTELMYSFIANRLVRKAKDWGIRYLERAENHSQQSAGAEIYVQSRSEEDTDKVSTNRDVCNLVISSGKINFPTVTNMSCHRKLGNP